MVINRIEFLQRDSLPPHFLSVARHEPQEPSFNEVPHIGIDYEPKMQGKNIWIERPASWQDDLYYDLTNPSFLIQSLSNSELLVVFGVSAVGVAAGIGATILIPGPERILAIGFLLASACVAYDSGLEILNRMG